ncbi:hypothetical protein CCR94_02885 [Rhodoblastus sphagnicola]|uniref:Filamentous haemagglutinin FhaB/tRNA nuclease CdiA-like TPS domain-containing protein n=1 Tax=Rhodoblastus sphagnicola TaxID=333368 RepID=A0A2S6NET2_9HYPH|nr:filamentous hemagglutinin N-terminal domain-containing protein [Rhodoblastus sphagnicola]MBB4196406.1 filamentous hemagglutinin family protein [Rhodoblastus sphagnicola]PPQ33128.1 hypothetical protein CCR94_02885 [Rhodoblastus sphagnicola]
MSARTHRRRHRANRGTGRRPGVAARVVWMAGGTRRRLLLAGASLLAMMVASPGAYAIDVGSRAAGVTSASNVASDAALAAARQAQQAAQNAAQSIKRATTALQSMQALQATAQAAAQVRQTSTTNPVAAPNGLGAGGLLPNAPAGWNGANAPTQAAGANNVNIRQTQAQAILNWTTFNVGARTTLTYDQQGNANWVALNRVDATQGPSQILGQIKADGQVYVINQSGVIFGGASQINVGSLIASTAGITDAQFKAKGIYSAQSGSTYTPSFTGAAGKVIVEQGAQIATNAPASVTSGGGFVMLLGAEVDNAGRITTPKGQTLFAAGDDFILRPGFGATANTFSTTRGGEVAPALYAGSASGAVDNAGVVFSQQGDITLAGHAIMQDGLLISTTSVNRSGAIHLLNSASDATGSVTLTGNAITAILPELDSTDTALNSQRDALIAASSAANLLRSQNSGGQFDNLSLLADRQDQSRIEIVTGNLVNFRSGSLTMAQGGQIAVSAGSRVFTKAGATLDVSGVRDVALAMSSNEVKVNIQGNELRDSPQNRDSGKLINDNAWVDLRSLVLAPAGAGGYASDRYYTPGGLLEVSGYLNNAPHRIGEWTAVGGAITLSAPQVAAQKGATFNISGGSLDYQGGWLQQSALLGSDGGLYDVNNAPANLTYKTGVNGFVVDHARAGVTEVYYNALGGFKAERWEDGYTVGRDAGRITIASPTTTFEADIIADVVNGQRQTGARVAGVTDGYKLTQNTVALPGTLALQGYGVINNAPTPVASATKVTFSNAAAPADPTGASWFNADAISSFGLGGITVWSTKGVTVTDALTLAPGGKVDFAAPSIDVYASLTARGGSVSLGSLAGAVGLIDANGAVHIGLHSGAMIDTRGLWTNLLTDPDADQWRLAVIDGGAVSLQLTGGDLTQTTRTGDITLDKGSRIDASAGGAILANGKFSGGKGADITLATYDWTSGAHQAGAGVLTLNGALASYG